MPSKIISVDDDFKAARNLRRIWPRIARKLNLFYKYHFGVFSVDTIPVSTDPDNPSYITGLLLFDSSSEGFEVIDAATGLVKNNTGRDLTMSGSVTYQGVNGTGGTAQLQLWSERSVDDGVTFEINQSSLRTTQLPNTSSGSQTKSAGIANWKSGESARFAIYNTSGGTLSLAAPTDTVNGGASVTGFSFYLQLNEV